MNKEKVLGVVRAILAAAGGYAVGKGYFDATAANEITGAVLVIISGVWSVLSKNEPAQA